MNRPQSKNRFLLVASLTLALVLFGARWAAREFPLSNRDAWRSAIWVDDQYLLVTQQSRSNERWGNSTKAKHFLVDCESNSWTDLGRELGIDDFFPRNPCIMPDGRFFLPRGYVSFGSIVRGIVVNPKTMQVRTVPIENSASYSVIGNQYLLSIEEQRCVDLVNNYAIDSLDLKGNVSPIDGAASFVIEYMLQPAFDPEEGGMGMGNDDSETDARSEVSTNSVEMEEPPPVEWGTTQSAEDLELIAEALRLGLEPTELILTELYKIVDGIPVKANRWFTRSNNWSPRSSNGLIAEANTSLSAVVIRSSESGEILRTFPAPPLSQSTNELNFEFRHGILLFRDSTGTILSALDVVAGDPFPIDRQSVGFIRNERYIVNHVRNSWAWQVQRLPTGEVAIDDLNRWGWCSLDFSADGESIKMLREDDSIVFLNVETGKARVLKPRATRVWLCYLIWGLVATWVAWWITKCNQLQLPIQLQAVVTCFIILLIGYWRLTLADTETIRERPAFFAMMGTTLWIVYSVFLWLLNRIPFLARLFTLQTLWYVSYFLIDWLELTPYQTDRLSLLAFSVVCVLSIVFVLLSARNVIRRLWNNELYEEFRFSIAGLIWLTVICGIFFHQIQLVNWEPIIKTGWRGEMWGPVPQASVPILLVICARWLSVGTARTLKFTIGIASLIIVALFSWNSIVDLTCAGSPNNNYWWKEAGYYVKAPLWFAGPVMLAGLSFSQRKAVKILATAFSELAKDEQVSDEKDGSVYQRMTEPAWQ